MVPRSLFTDEEEYKKVLNAYEKNRRGIPEAYKALRKNRGNYGLNHFLRMLGQTGTEMIYMGNIATAPPGKDPVDYLVEGLKEYKRKDIQIKQLELANEIYFRNQKWHNGFHDPLKYMRDCERATKQIREIYPNIKIAVIAAFLGDREGTGPQSRADYNRFNDSIASYPNKDFYDAVAIHSYIHLGAESKAALEQNMPRLRDRLIVLSKVLPRETVADVKNKFPGKEIWLTEAGLIEGGDTPPNMLIALFEADHLLYWGDYDDVVKMYLKHTSVHINQTIHTVTTPINMEKSSELLKTALYYGYSILSNPMKDSDTKLATKVENKKTIMTKWREEPVQLDELNARALLSRDKKEIYVLFTNISKDQKAVRLKLGKLPLANRSVEVTTLSGSLTDYVTVDEPYKVRPVITNRKADEVILIPGYSVGCLKIDAGEVNQMKL